jgi:hypothetical protein
MNDQEQQLQQVELTIEQAKQYISNADALNRLHENPDFQQIVLYEYFEAESKRAVLLKSDPEMQGDDGQKQVDNVILGIGGLYAFFNKIYQYGNQAHRSLPADQQTQEEILQEQLDEETLQ